MKEESTFSLSYEQLLQETKDEIKRLVSNKNRGKVGFLYRWEQANGVLTFWATLMDKVSDGNDTQLQNKINEDNSRLQRLLGLRPVGKS